MSAAQEQAGPPDIWSALPMPVLLVGPDGTISRANPAAEQFFNASARRLQGEALTRALRSDPPLDEALARVGAEGADLRIRDLPLGAGPHAPQRSCNLHLAPWEGAGPGGAIVVIEPQRLSRRRAAPGNGLASGRSVIGLAEMLAHEIKNPLAGITGAAQLLAMELGPEQRELTDLIVAESRRIVALLEEVERFGDRSPPQLRAHNIHDVLDRARRLAMVGFAAHMQIIEEYDPSLPLALVDADKLLQAVLNLLKNAAEAAPDGGVIRIRTSYDLGARISRGQAGRVPLPLLIEIVDDGPGLPPEIADEVFAPFVSGRESGTGLGLALVNKIISEQGGWIDVHSVPGRTAFRMALPLAPRESRQEAPETAGASAAARGNGSRRQRRAGARKAEGGEG